MTQSILILNGPNLNLLGSRQPEIYGSETLADIEARCVALAKEIGISIGFEQSNSEGALIDIIHAAKGRFEAIVLNAGAYTHTSLAIADALRAVELPVIELHLSNVQAREAFRHHSFIAPLALGVICGFGPAGYEMALSAMARHLSVSP